MTSIVNFKRVLGVGERWVINTTGSKIAAISGAGNFDVEPQSQNPLNGFRIGLIVGFPPFDSVTITNGDTAQTLELLIGDGDIVDNRLVGQIDITGGIKISANGGVAYGAVTALNTVATLVAAANLNRSSILVQNNGSFPAFIGSDNAVTNLNGLLLNAGGSTKLTFEASVYLYANGGNCDIRYLDESTS
jgi:hypothetical protein